LWRPLPTHALPAGYTGSNNFPTLNASQGSLAGGYDAFVAKLLPAPPPPVLSSSPK
jgi:hypothetical protein